MKVDARFVEHQFVAHADLDPGIGHERADRVGCETYRHEARHCFLAIRHAHLQNRTQFFGVQDAQRIFTRSIDCNRETTA